MGGGETTSTVSAPRELSDAADEINHLVCCRSAWDTAMCGLSLDGHPINLRSEFICTMCIEEAHRRSGGRVTLGICPVDGEDCPTEAEVDVRISWEIS